MEKQKMHTTLAVWPTDTGDAFSRIGMGRCTVDSDSDSGSLTLSFRARDNEGGMPYISRNDPNPMDVCLYIWISTSGGHSMEFNANGVYYAGQARVESILKLMKKWNAQAQRLYMGGSESFDTELRRMIAATGAKTALRIGSGYGGLYPQMRVEDAIQSFVMPAVELLRSRLKRVEAA